MESEVLPKAHLLVLTQGEGTGFSSESRLIKPAETLGILQDWHTFLLRICTGAQEWWEGVLGCTDDCEVALSPEDYCAPELETLTS